VKDQTIRRVLAFFLLISVVLLVVAIEAVRNINRSAASSDWVNHTHAVILEAEGLLSSVRAGDGAMRTYVMTGDARDQAACREAFAQVAEHIEVAKALTRNEPAQSQQMLQLEALAAKRADTVREILTARQLENAEAVRKLLAADNGGETVSEIQRKVEKLKADEMALLAERDTAAYAQAQTTRWTVWVGVILDVLLLAGAAWLIRDDLAARRQAATALQEANQQLDAKVRERTTELAAANAQLALENLERQWTNQSLEHQLRYNQLIINSINDLVFVLTKGTKISRINPAAVHLIGLEAADLINQPLSRFVQLVNESGSKFAPLIDPIVIALKEGRDLRDQTAVLLDRRGRQTRVNFTLFPLRDRDKVVGGVVTLQLTRPAAGAPA
jgi:CHASE3 domain sensor protein